MDVSNVPVEIISVIVGTILRVIYDMLFWAQGLSISGKEQPLLIILEEAHLFLPEGKDSPAARIIKRIAKEGRKYGVGLGVVTQRPSEIESTVLSQCGTMIALRTTNDADKSKIKAAFPEDLGALSSMLPSLRTGEGLVIGEAMPIPSRIQFYKSAKRPKGDDPELPEGWMRPQPPIDLYKNALHNWRNQKFHK